MTVRLALRRTALGALLAAVAPMAVLSAWPSCEPHDPASAGPDLGTTYGAEISLRILGRGSVASTPTAIDCPSTCFARIVLADRSVDGGDGGVTLVANETIGSHFVSWSVDDVDLGVRAGGPPQCSPMTRPSATPLVDSTSREITVAFGETTGKPPRGREDECADFTKVPVAYALTATFEDDIVDPPNEIPDPGPGADVLFASPGGSSAKEIGVAGGVVYWRYEQSGASGVASAFPGGPVNAILAPIDELTLFHVGEHVVFQHSGGQLEAIAGGDTFPVMLGGAPTCAALASDVSNVYCRSNGAAGSTLYVWPISGAAAPRIVHVLPPGRALAADGQRFYFSRDEGGFADQASIVTAPLSGDGGMPVITALVSGQTSPRDLIARSSYLFWLDDQGSGVFSARSAYKLAAGSSQAAVTGSQVRFVAADPFSSSYFVGIGGVGLGASSIYRAFAGSTSIATLRTGITGLGGLAADSGYVYWTQSDGRVYRAATNDLGLGGP
jgi:hypothetical protein